ncbi:testis-expressed basic protein 1 [Desmodus rotundus]|uniref:testis-expressed basic protein 1 n=1 Tax=Desmodus rotundus TaxID=9430 RepID=UPI0023817DB4|nr:testis-expressed basic protein 1 [Desmodus rotundus]
MADFPGYSLSGAVAAAFFMLLAMKQSGAGLLDYEDGRGLRHSYSTESDTSCDDQDGSRGDYTSSANSPALSRSSIGDIKSSKATPRPFYSTPGAITGAIGPIMQFSAPIPGATGPIKLTQKTIVQTPGPIVQYAGSSAGTSEMTTGSTPRTITGPTPHAVTAPPAKPSGPPVVPLMISQRTSTRPATPKALGPPAAVLCYTWFFVGTDTFDI